MKFRPGKPDDVEAVVPMLAAHYDLHARFDPARFTPRPDFESGYRRWLTQRSNDPQAAFFVAETETQPNRVVGFVVATIERDIPVYAVQSFGFIHDLWVEPDYRNEGVGRQLVMLAVEALLQRGATQVRAEVAWANRPARSLMEQLGFRPSSVLYLAEFPGPEGQADPGRPPEPLPAAPFVDSSPDTCPPPDRPTAR